MARATAKPTPAAPLPTTRDLDLDALLDDRAVDVLVCCGSGGVGKTTTAAALAVRAAERGRTVVVLTIDPARRLAQSLGLTELDNTPRPVASVDTAKGGSLEAMMLDMKRTFDDIVEAHTTPEKAQQIFANPFYVSLSSSFAGTQEYMAMEKLGQLKALGTYDLVIVDTPPTRSALDFLDAPQRLSTFLDGRFLKIFLAPAKAGGRASLKLVNLGLGAVTKVVTKIIGAQLLTDVTQFVAALETMFGGFRERAEQTYHLLAAPGTAFVVVAAPEEGALREAAFFVERLAEERMPLAGLVVNRTHAGEGGPAAQTSERAATTLAVEHPLAAAALRAHASRARTAEREDMLVERFATAHPAVRYRRVPALATDVHDLEGLRAVGASLGG